MTSINYQHKRYKDIFGTYLQKAASHKLINDDPEYLQDILNSAAGIENVLIMELAIHSEMLAETYTNLTKIYKTYDLDKALGKDLDNLLEPFLKRRLETHATAQVNLTREKGNEQEITIPAGTIISSTQYPEILFQTILKKTIPPDKDNCIIDAACTIPGPQGNIPPHTLNKTLPSIRGIQKIDNPQPATGGRNQEDDDSYRARGKKWSIINTKGTYQAFKNAIENIAGVENYHIQRRWDGPGTTRIIIKPPIPKVLETVDKSIQNICAIDEEYCVIGAENKPINININIKVDTNKENPTGTLKKEEITTQVQNAIKTYIEGKYDPQKGQIGGLSLGEDFIPIKAATYILSTVESIRSLDITYPPSIIPIEYYQEAVCGELNIETN